MRQVVLDTETTGLRVAEGHRIIEIGCIELINRKFTGKRFHQYMNPEREVEKDAVEVHGLTNDFLQEKPLFEEIADELMAFLAGAELIIHNASFDLSFLQNELQLTKKSYPVLTEACRIIDTLQLARQLHMGQRNSLDALCKRYGIDNSQRDLHGALLDANLLAQVYLAMTGGQGSLFDEITAGESTTKETKTDNTILLSSKKLHVLYATEEEMSAHEEKLELLKKKGKCVWN